MSQISEGGSHDSDFWERGVPCLRFFWGGSQVSDFQGGSHVSDFGGVPGLRFWGGGSKVSDFRAGGGGTQSQ